MKFSSFNGLANHLRTHAVKSYKARVNQELTEIGEAIADDARKSVGIYQQPVGQYPGWAPLKPSTLLTKISKGHGKGGDPNTPLYATGKFQRDISYRVNKSKQTVTIGTKKDYIIYTELGTSKMPPRPVFGPAAARTLPKRLKSVEKAAYNGLAGYSGTTFPGRRP